MIELYLIIPAIPIVSTSAMIVVYRMVMVVVVMFVMVVLIVLMIVLVMMVMMMMMMDVAVRQPRLLRRRTGLLRTETQGGRNGWWTRWKDQR